MQNENATELRIKQESRLAWLFGEMARTGEFVIDETGWTQSGKMLLYSGHEEDSSPHTQGVALMLSPTASRSLIGWEA